MHFFNNRKRRKKIKKIILSLVISISIIGFILVQRSYSADNPHIRVAVVRDKDKVSLLVKGPYEIKAIQTDLLLDKDQKLSEREIIPTNTGFKMGDDDFKIYGMRIIPRTDSTIYIDGKSYRGIVDVIRTKNLKLLVVNHIDIEQYLYGVLYHEMPHYWPYETLKAQAVAARTFALYRINVCKEKDFDVTNDIYSQMYGGRKSERWRSTRAVKATHGEVLTYDGKVLPAYYHSICAGHTEDAEQVFDVKLTPLRGRKDPYCKGARNTAWKAMFSYRQMEDRLTKYGVKVKGFKSIEEGKRDPSGRLTTVDAKDSSGLIKIPAFKFRLALGPNVIKSTNFKIKVTPAGVVFRGTGWGHGVGMCQWGAFGMAKRRFNYRKILEFYYPGAKIERY